MSSINLKVRKVSEFRWDMPAKNSVVPQTTLGDFNEDGKTDFALSMMDIDGQTNDVKLFLGQGLSFIDGTYLLSNPVPTYQTSNILSTDLNKDGLTDLIISRSGGDGDTLANNGIAGDSQLFYISQSNGTYKAITSSLTPYIHNVMIDDLDGDGDTDAFFFATSIGPSLLAFNNLNQSDAITFTTNGLPDKAVNSNSAGSWDVIERHPNGALKKMEGWHHHNSAFNDIDRDGDLDMVLFFAGSLEGLIYKNDGSANFNTTSPLRYDATVPGIPASGHYLYGLLNEDGSWKGLEVKKQGVNYYETVQFDVNEDGWEDIVAVGTYENHHYVNVGQGQVYLNDTDRYNHGTLYNVLINTGSGLRNETAQRVTQPNVTRDEPYHYGHYTMLSVVDLNGDGFLDFTSQQNHGGVSGQKNWAGESDTVFMLNNGAGKFSEVKLEGLEFASVDPIPVNGKLGFAALTVPTQQDWKLPGFPPRPWAMYEFYQTDIPWTTGDDRDNFLYGTVANDSLIGYGGVDTYYVNGREFEFSLQKKVDWSVTDRSGLMGTDTLAEIERIKFDDKKLALDLDGNAGQVAKILGAVFGKSAITNKEYVGIGLSLLDGGMSYEALANLAMSVTSKTSSTDICTLLWTNVMGSSPTAADIVPFKAMLESGQLTVGSLTTLAADTVFNTNNIDLVGLATTGIEYV